MQVAILEYLKSESNLYYGKLLELRHAIQGWLNYIPQTFPHYTRHTVEHSDEIILQVSKLLFKENDPAQPVVRLSAIEAYMLGASAYLHDAGMVVSDSDKLEMLASDEWRSWTTGGGPAAKRLEEILRFRLGQEPTDETVRHFLADVQMRYLIAEFARRTHHFRGAEFITQNQSTLGRFAFDDPILLRAISNICLSHGLRAYELDDGERFPDRTDIRGELSSVRFVAILLRLGDLLDMTYDRACPLLLNAACPIPSDSLAHWTQYQRIMSRLTASDRIELVAECETQDEHRVLQDWCQWLVDEVRNASVVIARSRRHRDWQVPSISLQEPRATIRIRPSAGATYIPSKWTFVLDEEAVFQRLVYDVYDSPEVFIRELIQNALDATRCQMYADLVQEGFVPPPYPTQVDDSVRSRYPLKISLRTIERTNTLAEETEIRQLLSVEDHGIGMDREVIHDYLLQVGRSYYTSENFRRNFGFVPASRFGLGFLSVFAASDEVTIETFKPRSPAGDGPIRLTLTGPRNYLLMERGERGGNGTRVDVLLRSRLTPGRLSTLVSNWCPRVEFPILVDDLGTQTEVSAESPDRFTYEIPDVTEEGASLAVKAFTVNRPGVAGELYVFARIDSRGESWVAWDWARYTYPTMHPKAVPPKFPATLVCLHGISLHGRQEDQEYVSRSFSARVDYRGETQGVTLSRAGAHREIYSAFSPELAPRWAEILEEHLKVSPRAGGPDGWRYRQNLAKSIPLAAFWTLTPGMIRGFEADRIVFASLKEIQEAGVITVLLSHPSSAKGMSASELSQISSKAKCLIILDQDLRLFPEFLLWGLFKSRGVNGVSWLGEDALGIEWDRQREADSVFARARGPIRVAALPSRSTIAFTTHLTLDTVYADVLLNREHPLVEWIVRVRAACREGSYGLQTAQFDILMELLDSAARYPSSDYLGKLKRFLDAWKLLGNVPPELIPPEVELNRSVFQLARELTA